MSDNKRCALQSIILAIAGKTVEVQLLIPEGEPQVVRFIAHGTNALQNFMVGQHVWAILEGSLGGPNYKILELV